MNVSAAAQKSDILPGRMASVWQGSVMSEDRFLSGSGSVGMITTTSSAYLVEGYRSSFSKSWSTVSP
jgi:hypothetical protein